MQIGNRRWTRISVVRGGDRIYKIDRIWMIDDLREYGKEDVGCWEGSEEKDSCEGAKEPQMDADERG